MEFEEMDELVSKLEYAEVIGINIILGLSVYNAAADFPIILSVDALKDQLRFKLTEIMGRP